MVLHRILKRNQVESRWRRASALRLLPFAGGLEAPQKKGAKPLLKKLKRRA